MPGSVNIYGPRTSTAVRKIVKNFNAKIIRELKKDPAAAAWLPDRISVKQIKAENQTRADVNKTLRDLRGFTAKGAQQPVYLNENLQRTAWEVKKVYRDAEQTNKRRARELKQLAPDTKSGNMGLVERNNLMPIKIHPQKMSLKDWKAKAYTAGNEAKSSFNQRQQLTYKENYLTAVENILGPFGGPIKKLLQSVSPAQMTAGYKNNPILNIGYLYDPQEAAFIALNVLEAWQDFLGLPNTAEEDIGGIEDAYFDEDSEDDF